jgi:hypothetical protein
MVADFLQFTYLVGPNAPPAYQNVTVDEIFSPRTSNLKMAWLTQATLDSQPQLTTDAQWRAFYFPGTGSANSTFYIGAANTFGDLHSGTIFRASAGLTPANLNAAGLGATISVSLPQVYQCPPGTRLGNNWTILRQWVGKGDGTGTFQMQKN